LRRSRRCIWIDGNRLSDDLRGRADHEMNVATARGRGSAAAGPGE